MIKKLHIERFKSIKSLSLDCRKVNLFIGEPDTGKTNILEALSFVSRLGWSFPIGTSLRLSPISKFDTLFHRQFLEDPVLIAFDDVEVSFRLENQRLRIAIKPGATSLPIEFDESPPHIELPQLKNVRYYSYTNSSDWGYETRWSSLEFPVAPPNGPNLLYLARHNSKVYDLLKKLAADLDWKLRFDQNQRRFTLSEVRGDDIFDYNLEMASDSSRRLFFYEAILMTNHNAVLVLDEPDVYAFPPYPKLLGEMIARDTTNQFFLTTHNPYFLAGVVEKTPAQDLALFVCFRDPTGATSARQLGTTEVQQVIEHGASVFFNLDSFVKP